MRYKQLQSSAVGKQKKATAALIGVIVTLCLISFLYSQRFVTTLPSSTIITARRTIQSLPTNEFIDPVNITEDIEKALSSQRDLIDQEIKHHYDDKNSNTSISLSNYVPELGGKPIRSIIIATWRSGSTFLGDILNSVPGTYYHYEPLLDHGIVQVRGPPLAIKSIAYIKNLLQCNYTGMDNYLSYGQEHNWLFTHNIRLWETCSNAFPHLCWHAPFLNKFCSLFPFQSMKLVRLRLNLIEEILADKNLGIKVLLVVRDPRGTMQSRKHREWCPGNLDCADPAALCADLVSDYSAALRLVKKFPESFRALRYEDFSLDPYKGTKSLLKFFGLEYGLGVKRYLDTHTKWNSGGVSSTFRNSKSAPFHWRSDLDFKEVADIQKKCKSAMGAWGYLKAGNASHQRKFKPISSNFILK